MKTICIHGHSLIGENAIHRKKDGREIIVCRECNKIRRRKERERMGIKKRDFHGCAKMGQETQEYSTWKQIKKRCYNKNDHNYHLYGGRGITMCERWLKSFPNFLADMGPRPTGLTIERIDNSKGYSKENCKWATMQEQNWNKRDIKMITFQGETKPTKVWERELGFSSGGLRYRLKKGMSMKDAVATPIRNNPQPRSPRGGITG